MPDAGPPVKTRADAGQDAGTADAGTGNAKGKQLQLTFDDGPIPVLSALRPIIAAIADLKVKAAFFVIGEEVKKSHSAIAEITKAGHIIGNHSWDHLKDGPYTDIQIYEQFRKTHAEVKSAGTDMLYWRAPRGENTTKIGKVLLEPAAPNKALYKLSHCAWQADSRDSLGPVTVEAMIGAIEKDFNNTGIAPLHLDDGTRAWRLLFHVKNLTGKSLPEILKYFADQGHHFIDFSQSR